MKGRVLTIEENKELDPARPYIFLLELDGDGWSHSLIRQRILTALDETERATASNLDFSVSQHFFCNQGACAADYRVLKSYFLVLLRCGAGVDPYGPVTEMYRALARLGIAEGE